jgi:hypothetical protein
MRVSLKLIGVLWIGLFLIIGVLLFNAYSKLKPETFIALITEQVQKNYPGAELKVGKVSYGFSLDFTMNLRDLHLRRSGKLLGSVGEVELKVPWWLLLFNQGNAQINLSKLDIFIDNSPVPALSKPTGKSNQKVDSSLIKVTLPSYLNDANFTLRAKEVSIRDINNARRYFTVSKLLVREFQYGKNSAFELNIPIEIKHNDVHYLSELWLFGDVTPDPSQWNLNYRGEFRTKETNEKFQIEDLVINGKASFIPSSLAINSDLNLLIDKARVGHGDFKASQDSLTVSVDFDSLPLEYFGLIYEEMKNPYLKKLKGTSAGSIKFHKNFDNSVASIKGKLAFYGDFIVSGKEFIVPGTWKIGFEDSRWEISFISPKGEVSFFRRSVMDMKKNQVTQYIEELGFTGLDMNLVLVATTPLSNFISEVPESYYTTSVAYNKCLQGETLITGNFRYGLSPEHKFYQGDLKAEESSLDINYSNKAAKHALDMNFQKFQIGSPFNLLTPYFTAANGILDGKVEGRWSESWMSGEWLMKINGESLHTMGGQIPQFISKTVSFFTLDPNLPSKLGMNLIVKNNILTINSLLLENPESAKITGSLSSKQKSILTLTYPKNKKFKPIKKEVIEPYWIQKEEI